MTTQTAGKTIKQWLEEIANKDSSNEADERIMQSIIQRLGFPTGRVLYGIVYLEGEGHPVGIQLVAQYILNIYSKQEGTK